MMSADPMTVVYDWLAQPASERGLLGHVFGQTPLGELDDIREEATARAHQQRGSQDRIGGVPATQFWTDVARVAEIISYIRLTAAGFLPQEMTADLPAQDIIEADRAYLAAQKLLTV
jgi:hypothetical protein